MRQVFDRLVIDYNRFVLCLGTGSTPVIFQSADNGVAYTKDSFNRELKQGVMLVEWIPPSCRFLGSKMLVHISSRLIKMNVIHSESVCLISFGKILSWICGTHAFRHSGFWVGKSTYAQCVQMSKPPVGDMKQSLRSCAFSIQRPISFQRHHLPILKLFLFLSTVAHHGLFCG